MRIQRLLLFPWIAWLALILALFPSRISFADKTPFQFNLEEPRMTSAGVFKTDGTLVRTLWSKVKYPAGTNRAMWDGMDDLSNQLPAENYEIKLLQHDVKYVWDGAIGNTSAEKSGPSVHRGFYPMRGMAITGTNAYYVSGYNEGGYAFRKFLTTDPQHVQKSWYWVYSEQFQRSSSVPGDVNDRNWLWTATDGIRVYFACSTTLNPVTLSNDYSGCVVACNVSDESPAFMTNGTRIFTSNGAPLPNGIYVGKQSGLSGLAVQRNGNLLAASVVTENRIYLFDKNSGTPIKDFAVAAPGRLNFSPSGSLWVVSEKSVLCFANPKAGASPTLAISNLSKPLDVAVDPKNANLILIADGGGAQQVKAFDGIGNALWTYGSEGGYQKNGPTVANNKFWFFDGEHNGTFICFADDGSFWVGDGGNHRSLHFSARREYIEQIMFQPHSYTTCVDQNNPSRVFNEFLEFKVDYSEPLSNAWTLVNNWGATLDDDHKTWNDGLYEVTTFTNGRTYGLVDNATGKNVIKELVELGTNGLRLTGIFPMVTNQARWISLGADGSVRATAIGIPAWFRRTLKGFDAKANPFWNTEELIASAPPGAKDPVPRCCSLGNVRATISSNNIVVAFDQTLNDGWHLGGIRLGSTNWLWKASPSTQWMNGAGIYEIANGVNYAGNTVQALDRHIIYGYHGEFFRRQGQAAQTMHFLDDGLFIGQFGEASPGHYPYEAPIPAFAGNAVCPNLVKTASGDYYLWVNDESGHGPQRWHFVNAQNILEQTGSGKMGSTIQLTNPSCDFPARLSAVSGNDSATLTWKPVTGANSYAVKISPLNGGPFHVIAGITSDTKFTATNLLNGTNYYFAVTAKINGRESIPSEQICVRPFDAQLSVQAVGDLKEGGQFTPMVNINSAGPSLGRPSYGAAEHLTASLNLEELCDYGFGNLMNRSVGKCGYVIYNSQNASGQIVNLTENFTVVPSGDWTSIDHLQRQFRLDKELLPSNGAVANLTGSISITAKDKKFHYLTVVSPDQFNNPRTFEMSLTSADGTKAAYTIDERIGYSHLFQFLFKGDTILSVKSSKGGNGIVQALFFDDVFDSVAVR